MKSNFRKVGSFNDHDKVYDVYYDHENKRYLKINDTEVKEITEEEKKELKKILDKRFKEWQSSRMRKFTFFMVGTIFIGSMNRYYNDNESYVKSYIEYELSDKDENDVFNFFWHCVRQNRSIPYYRQDEIFEYLKVVSKYEGIPVKQIGNNLKNIDFSVSSSIKDFLYQVFDYKNGKFIVDQLYYYINDTKSDDEIESIISSYIFNRKDLINDVVAGNDVKVDEYTINLDDLMVNSPEVIYYLSKFNKNFVEEIQTAHNFTEYKCEQTNNIFSDYFQIYLTNQHVCFYFENINGKWISTSYFVYYRKLNNYINKYGSDIGTHDTNDRILLFLYAEALRKSNGFIPENISSTEFIYDAISSTNNEIDEAISVVDLMRFLSGEGFNYSKLYRLGDIAAYKDAYHLINMLNAAFDNLFLELNISDEDYKEFLRIESESRYDYDEETKEKLQEEDYKLELKPKNL